MKELQPLYNYLSVRSVTASVGLGIPWLLLLFRSGFQSLQIRVSDPDPQDPHVFALPGSDPHKFADPDPGKKVRK